jgi:hypothetical protein
MALRRFRKHLFGDGENLYLASIPKSLADRRFTAGAKTVSARPAMFSGETGITREVGDREEGSAINDHGNSISTGTRL